MVGLVCEIHVQGHLAKDWSDWFEGLQLRSMDSGNTVLTGIVADQAALIGLLARMQALNVRVLRLQVHDGTVSDTGFSAGAGI